MNKVFENEYAYVADDKVFLKGYNGMDERQIGVVKNSPEQAVEYFINRYNLAVKKVDGLSTEIEEAQNKGSYLTKLIQLRKRLLSYDGIGDFNPLLKKLDEKEVFLKGLIQNNQNNNLSIKEALMEEARLKSQTEDYKQGSIDLQDIKTKWIRTGPADNDNEELEAKFTRILDEFYQKRKAYYDEYNRIIDERLATYQALLDTAFGLRRLGDLDLGFAELKRLQSEWRVIGEIPIKKSKNLTKLFKKTTTNFYEYYCREKGIKVEKRVDPRLKQQMDMVDEVERLAKSEDIFQAAERAKVMLNDWKNIKVPLNLADKRLPERFRTACDKIFELSYLMKVISRKYPAYQMMTEIEREMTKFREMDFIVKRARFDLQQLEDEMKFGGGIANADRAAQSNLMTQRRKLQMKEMILEEYRTKIQG